MSIAMHRWGWIGPFTACLVGDAHATPAGSLGQLLELFSQRANLTQRMGLHARADQDQVGAEFLHQVELALGAVEAARDLRRRDASTAPPRQ
jgi:hypothetical protein